MTVNSTGQESHRGLSAKRYTTQTKPQGAHWYVGGIDYPKNMTADIVPSAYAPTGFS